MNKELKYLIHEDRYMTKADKTKHTHELGVNDDGDGITVGTSEGPDHQHYIIGWLVKNAKSHSHIINK